jgi:integrase
VKAALIILRSRVQAPPARPFSLGRLRVRVYSGMDPISRRRMYLTEVVPPGSKAGDQAKKVLSRLLHQVDQKRNPRTRATVGQLLDRWLQVLDVDPSTQRLTIETGPLK